MKIKHLGHILLFVLLLSMGCKKEDTSYEANYIYDFEIPAGTSLAFEHFSEMESRRDYWLAQHGLTRDQIKGVEVRFARYTIVGSNERFDWIDRAFLRIGKYDPAVPSPSYFEIAFNLQVPNTQGGTLDLAPDLTELKDYFLADKFRLQHKFINKLNHTTTMPLQVRLSLVLSIFKN